MRNVLLSIVGPTATGKTQFALDLSNILAEEFHIFDVISADSRQVYQGMEIGTGADIPPHFQKQQYDPSSVSNFVQPYFKRGAVRIHGVSILKPNQEWSVAQFRDFTQNIMTSSWNGNGLPILVGGTGLYHQHIFTHDQKIEIPPNDAVRQHAERISLADLQRWLKETNAIKFESMNNSDRHNPRRLIRAIEIELASRTPLRQQKVHMEIAADSSVIQHCMIGLTDSMEHISQRIGERIKSRLGQGVLEEVQRLMTAYEETTWMEPAFSATGCKEVRAYLEDKISYQQMQELWQRREVQYAKRQLTWWKKQNTIHWHAVHEASWRDEAISQIKRFLYTAKHAQNSQ